MSAKDWKEPQKVKSIEVQTSARKWALRSFFGSKGLFGDQNDEMDSKIKGAQKSADLKEKLLKVLTTAWGSMLYLFDGKAKASMSNQCVWFPS